MVIDADRPPPAVLDIEAFALANAYQMNYPERTDPLAALDPRRPRAITIVCLLERGEPVFTRDISIGGQVHVDALLRDGPAWTRTPRARCSTGSSRSA